MSTPPAHVARIALPLLAAALVLSGCGSSTSGNDADPSPPASETSEVVETEVVDTETVETEAGEIGSASGAYVTLADYESAQASFTNSDVVLFFNASWCSTCKEVRENLEADPSAIPAGLTIVKVDFDDSDELRQKYGVTVQHTFVQVDSNGNELAKWNGSVTADEIAQQTV